MLRGDTATLARLVDAPDAQAIVLIEGKPVIRSSADRSSATLRWLDRQEMAQLAPSPLPAFFLGRNRRDGAPRFALSVSTESAGAAALSEPLSPSVDLRSLMAQGVLTADEIEIAAVAVALHNWHHDAGFCGRCGTATEIREGGWKRACTTCSKDWFPRTDPVVIMLVTDGQRCVLAREPRFPDLMVSTLAGFVEPGETIEQAVARETAEEVGILVEHVSYHASQSWSFPHSLMIGCFARCAAGATLSIDPREITEARWFSRAEVRQMLARTHEEGLWLPGPHAIANLLIRSFVSED